MYFSEWLKAEMEQRGMGVRELARQAGVSPGTISHILNGTRGPGPETCTKIARALDMPEILVFMKAGLMEETREETELTLRELYEILKDLPIEEQRAIVAEARDRYRDVHGEAPRPEPATT